MKFHYCLNAEDVLNPSIFKELNILLKRAGVGDIWLTAYFTGRFRSTLEDLTGAADILKESGYNVGALIIPVGHPGNALDPENESIILEIPDNWRYRINKDGKKVLYCADIEEQMIKDNINAVKKLIRAGFTGFFMDDDLRLGNWGNEIQGCFCDRCIAEFNERFSKNISREMLRKQIISGRDPRILRLWVKYNCDKVTDFIKRINTVITESGANDSFLGIMVMHLGDERHGINLGQIVKEIPKIKIRIGEDHFDDRSMQTPLQRADEFFGMLLHLNFVKIENAYSETTIFPPNALSPENWIFKAKMAASLGLKNIFLMGGTRLIEERYWKYLKTHKNEIYSLYDKTRDRGIRFPIHVLIGDYLTDRKYPVHLITAGIPVKPIRQNNGPNSNENETDGMDNFKEENKGDHGRNADNRAANRGLQTGYPLLLYIPDGVKIKPARQTFRFIKRYDYIIISKNLKRTLDKLTDKTELKHPKILTFNGMADRLFKFYAVKKIKKICKEMAIPFIHGNKNIGILWLGTGSDVILINFESGKKYATIIYNDKKIDFTLNKYEFKYMKII